MLRAEMWKKQYQVTARENAEMAKELSRKNKELARTRVVLQRHQQKQESILESKRMASEARSKQHETECALRELQSELDLTKSRCVTLCKFLVCRVSITQSYYLAYIHA